MIKVTKEIIDKCAQNLLFELSEGQCDQIYDDFMNVMIQIDYLKDIPMVDETRPMTFPYSEHQKLMREDVPTKPNKVEDQIRNSNTKLGSQIKLPKVVGNENDKVDE